GRPELDLRTGIHSVMVQHDAQAELTGSGHDLIENLQPVESLQVLVDATVKRNAIGNAAGKKELVRERQANSVIAQSFDLLEQVMIIALPQAVNYVGGGFKAKPVDARNAYWLIGLVDDLGAAGVPEARADGRRRGW